MSVSADRVNLVPLFASLVKNHHGDFNSLLDLGCGELRQIWKKRWGDKYQGLDIRTKIGADYYGDACDLSRFKDNYYEVVTAWSTVEHVRHPYRMLEEAKRVSKGTCIFTTDLHPRDKNRDPTHLYSWTPKTLTQLVSEISNDCNVYHTNNMLIGVMYRCGINEN